MLSYDDIRAILDDELPNIRDYVLDEITKSILSLKEDTNIAAPLYSLEDLNNIRIMGYCVSDLIIVAERLRAGGVDIMKLKDYNQAFIDGYQRAQADFNKAMQECIKNTVDSVNNLDVK